MSSGIRYGANCLAALYMDRHASGDAHRLALDQIREVGYHATEISQPGLLSLGDTPAVRRHAEAIGLEVHAVHAPPMRRDPSLYRQKAAAVMAEQLGAAILVVHVSSIRFASADPAVRAEARERDLARLEMLAQFCEERGVAIALENGLRPGHAQYLFSLLHALGRPDAGLVFDSGHAALRGGDAEAMLQSMLPRLLHTHLHDNHGDRDEHLVPGQGIIDWPGLLSQLATKGSQVTWLLELRPRRRSGRSEWQRELRAGREALGKV
jgi:sugar phosphate isomerase/epimerase